MEVKDEKIYMQTEIKGSVFQKDVTVANLCAPKRASEYINQVLTEWKREINSSTVIENVSTLL